MLHDAVSHDLQVIDNREFWGGSLIGSLVPSTAENPEIFLSQVLK